MRPGTANLQLKGSGPGKTFVWGDYLSSETRAIMGVMKMRDIPYEFMPVDTLKGEHKKEAYLKQSFCEVIPMISNNEHKFIGGESSLKFLKNYYPEVGKELYPPEMETEIDRSINWFYTKMRPDT